MLKQEKYDWKDTNMALFGTDIEKNIKKASAQGEPQWKHVGEKIELRIWRIEQFRVVEWPRQKYGKFYDGDSYIILNTFLSDPKDKKLSYDAHFFIGMYSTQDEYGTAAYKTVELDHILDDRAVQHREVQGNESALFLSYFPKGLTILKGGTESGFNHVEVNHIEIKPHLLWIKGGRNGLILKEVKLTRAKMNSGDVFVLDIGPKIWLWYGRSANPFEKKRGSELVHAMKEERGGRCESFTIEEEEDVEGANIEFLKYLPHLEKGIIYNSEIKVLSSTKGGKDEEVGLDSFAPTLYAVTDGGYQAISSVTAGQTKFHRYLLEPSGIFLLDNGFHVFVWIGASSAGDGKSHAMVHAHNYLNKHKRPVVLPVTRITPTSETAEFKSFFDSMTTAPATVGCCVIS